MKKIIAFLLIFVLVFSLAGCKGADPKEKFYGTWVAEVDLADFLKAKIVNVNESLKDWLRLSEYPATITLTFNEDGSFERKVDGEFGTDTLDTLKAELLNGYNAYYADYLRGRGLDMTVEEFEKSSGISLKLKVEQVANADYLKNILNDLNHSGAYLVEEDHLYFGTHMNVEEKKNEQTYSLEEGKLTFEKAAVSAEYEEAFYPLTFVKKDAE